MPINYRDYAREFMTSEWIGEQFEAIEKKYPLKETGITHDIHHPYIQDLYLTGIQLRKAEALKQDMVLLNEGHLNIQQLGENLFLLKDHISNENHLRSKLQSKEQYEDTLWELEVATIFKILGIEFVFCDGIGGNNNDLAVDIEDTKVQVECKNKHVLDERFRNNRIFVDILTNKLADCECIFGKDIEIRFEDGNLSDIPIIIREINKRFDKVDYYNVLAKYKVKVIDKYKSRHISNVMQLSKYPVCVVARHEHPSQLYEPHSFDLQYEFRVFYSFPKEDAKLKNLETVLKKANKQLGSGGVVFLKVPKSHFNEAMNEVRNIFQRSCSNISAIKLVSLDKKFIDELGIKVERKEELIVNDHTKYPLNDAVKDFFKENLFFVRYQKQSE